LAHQLPCREAKRLHIGDAALPGNHHDGTGKPSAVDIGLERSPDAPQSRGRETDLFGFCCREACRVGRHRVAGEHSQDQAAIDSWVRLLSSWATGDYDRCMGTRQCESRLVKVLRLTQ
jgi:hypothetical protein